ncbi:tRNA N6-adenosine threonylcarbamoyltransferase [Acrasis kona]|uniref:tRNA N6-adenosine threonylcarbamoyltransferase n=1 Tax=Acrasis kona TaxID=1008807 RepID=A0AAW2YZU6_9EUKA
MSSNRSAKSIVDISTSDTNSMEFRQDLVHDHKIVIGHFSRNGHSFYDEEFTTMKRRSQAQGSVRIPSRSLTSLPTAAQKEIMNYAKSHKNVEIQDSEAEKAPEDNQISSEFDPLFEEDRDASATKHSPAITNLLLIGMQRTKEVRHYISKNRSLSSLSPIHPNMEMLMTLGELCLPFFVCKEAGDRVSQFQCENELSCAMKTLIDHQIKFFSAGGSHVKKRFVLGMIMNGSVVSSYLMRRVSDEDETVCMQMMDTYNINSYEDLLRLTTSLSLVRRHGEETYKEMCSKLKAMSNGQPGTSSQKSSNGNNTPNRQQQVKPNQSPAPNGSSTSPENSKKRHLEEDKSKTLKKPKTDESSANQNEDSSSDLDEQKE